MVRLTAISTLLGFCLSLTVGLVLLSSCSPMVLDSLQPFTPYTNACAMSGGSGLLNLWNTLLLTFTVVVSISGIVTFKFLGKLDVDPSNPPLLGHQLFVERFDHQPNSWRDPLLEALSAGTIQHGSRDR